MDEIYVVTAGAYSDFHIVAIFSEKDRAEEYAEEYESFRYSDMGEARVKTWPLDEPREELDGRYEVRIGPDGNVRDVNASEYGTPNEEPEHIFERQNSWSDRYTVSGEFEHHIFQVCEFEGYGQTEEEARRSAEQLRREFINTIGRTEDEYEEYLEDKEALEQAEEAYVEKRYG